MKFTFGSPGSKMSERQVPIVKTLTRLFNGSFAVKGGRLNLQWHLRVVGCLVSHRTSSFARATRHFIVAFRSIARKSGPVFLVKYLKACHVLTMQAAGGMRIPATQRLGAAVSRSSDGLPRIIPSWWRGQIRGGNTLLLRLSLTLFSVYRIIEIPGKLKLETITTPGKNLARWVPEIEREIARFWEISTWTGQIQGNLGCDFFPISSSGATSSVSGASQVSTSIVGLIRAAMIWRSSSLAPTLRKWLAATMNVRLLEHINVWSSVGSPWGYGLKPVPSGPAPLGKLGFKQEAAGKLRVFAMVDPFTNWLLEPVHKLVFAHLEGIQQDGTFNQTRPIEKLMNLGHTKFWCYDLSAATDRLPVDLQRALLAPIFGKELAALWRKLLIDREYSYSYKGNSGYVHYAVGQPMGALSSWAMLALTHHFIVQWAYRRSLGMKWSPKIGWFEDYAVLGDDIVIANGQVAREYVQIMEHLGVGIGFEKSLVSRKGALEFAKRYYCNGVNCSPLPYKEFMAARGSVGALMEFQSKYWLRLSQVLDVRGYGYRVKASLSQYPRMLKAKLRNLVLMTYAPGHGWDELTTWIDLCDSVPSYIARKGGYSLRPWSILGPRPVGSNWQGVLKEYVAYHLDKLGARLEAKSSHWNAMAKVTGLNERQSFGQEKPDLPVGGKYFAHLAPNPLAGLVGKGINIDFSQMHNLSANAQQQVWTGEFSKTYTGKAYVPQSVPGTFELPGYVTMSVANLVHRPPMRRADADLLRIEEDVAIVREWIEHFPWRSISPARCREILDEVYEVLEGIDSDLSSVVIPPLSEWRTRDLGPLFGNPVQVARLWARLETLLAKREKWTPPAEALSWRRMPSQEQRIADSRARRLRPY